LGLANAWVGDETGIESGAILDIVESIVQAKDGHAKNCGAVSTVSKKRETIHGKPARALSVSVWSGFVPGSEDGSS